MRALVVYESMFGNTRAVAEAIARSVGEQAEVELVEVGQAPPELPPGVDLLLVGGPTHAFGMSRASTREDAATKTGQPLVSTGDGLREWLEGLDRHGPRPAFAAFDTKVDKPRLPGSAAHAADRRLHKLGLPRAGRAETFYVDGMTGPLLDGELERAAAWAGALAAEAAAHPTAR